MKIRLLFFVCLLGLTSASRAADPPPTFRWVSYNGDPTKPESLDFQVTLDRKGPTQFYKLGDWIEGTRWKLERFEQKTQRQGQVDADASELTLRNTQTKEMLSLPLNKPVAVLTAEKTGK
jgi:hypothetical protein